MKKLLTPAEVEKEYGYAPHQMRNYEERGLIEAQRTPGGHRRYDPEAVEKIFIPNRAAVNSQQELTPRDNYKEFGTSGLRQWGGSIYEERLKALRGRAGRIEKREMRRNDPVISAIFFAILNALSQTTPRVAPASEAGPDREAAEFIDSCLQDMSFTWKDTFTFATEPQLEQGFSLLEVIYKRRLGRRPPQYIDNPAPSTYDDGRIGWRKLAPRPAESLADGSEWVFDDNGGIQGIIQQPETDFTGKPNTIYIPIQKLLHFRTTVHPANTPEGLEIHRAMYLPYFYSRHITELEAIGIERNLNGIPIAYMGLDTTRSGANSDFELLKDIVTNVRVDEQHGIVIPYGKMGGGAKEGEGVLVELLSPSGGGGNQFDLPATLDRLDKLKAVSVLAQFIMLGMNNVGSYSLSKHQGDIFILAISSFLNSIGSVFNRYGISKLIGMNDFPSITGLPTLEFSTVGVPDLQGLADYINKLVDKAVITPDEELERHLRQVADLPDLPEREIDVKPDVEEGEEDEIENSLKKKIIKQEPPDGLSAEGLEAYKETDKLRDDIAKAWEAFKRNILKGMAVAAAILLFKKSLQGLFTAAYLALWQLGRGDEADLGIEMGEIDQAVGEQMDYLDDFMEELDGELGAALAAGGIEAASLLDRRAARALSYAGAAWGLYNLARTFGARPDTLWVWDGAPIDDNSCPTCREELPKPPRRLDQMRLPVRDTECQVNCRHEVRRVDEGK